MNNIKYNAIDIIKGEQKFTMLDFIKEYKEIYKFNNRTNLTKSKIEHCINYIILDCAAEIERAACKFEYLVNIDPIYLIILNDTSNYFNPEVKFSMKQKFDLVELEFCLFAMLLRTKYFYGLGNLTRRSEKLNVLKNFADSYNNFIIDRAARETE